MATNHLSKAWVEKLEEVAFVNKAEADEELGELISILKGDLDFFPITSVARSEIRNALPVGKKYLADDDDFCSDVAHDMGETYVGNGYWIDLAIITEISSEYSEVSEEEMAQPRCTQCGDIPVVKDDLCEDCCMRDDYE